MSEKLKIRFRHRKFNYFVRCGHGWELTWASGPSSILQPVQGFQLGCGGDQETTPAGAGVDVINSSNTVDVTKETSFESGF